MNWEWLELTVTIIEHWIYADFMIRFLKTKSEKMIWLSYILILFSNSIMTLVLNHYMIFEGILGMIRIGMNIIFSLILLKGTLFEKLFVSFITDGIVLIINFLTLNVLSRLFGIALIDLVNEQGMLRLLTLFITKFLFYIATRVLINFKQRDQYIFSIVEWISLITVFLITMFIEIEIFNMAYLYDISMQSPTAIGIGIGLITVNILVYILMRRISRTNAEKTALLIDKMQLKVYKSQLTNFEKQYEEMQQIRHDMKNHLQCIYILLQKHENDEAQAYVEDIVQNKLNFGYARVKTGHRIVDIIANTKLAQCSVEQITTTVNINYFELEMDDVDICIILGNLFDNAIEACKDIKGKRFLFFEIVQRKGYVNLVIRNSISDSVLKHNPELRTTKKIKLFHGIGLNSVKNTVSRYGGMIDFYEKNQEFIVDIWIPSKKTK
ncbi:MAG: GHKL domain-containing protein [Oscillospiraceae bacterium]|nr:GHKL domain-containing protein [Oscillospiraceae bacterium]